MGLQLYTQICYGARLCVTVRTSVLQCVDTLKGSLRGEREYNVLKDNKLMRVGVDSKYHITNNTYYQVYIVGPLVASFLGAFSYELIFSFPLTFNVDESKTVDEKTAEVKAARKSVKNPKYEDIVMSNKINGTVAYD